MPLHEEVRRARRSHGLTQMALAEKAGVARSQLQLLEQGGNVTLDTLLKVLACLPDLTTVTLGPLELQLRHTDAAPMRRGLMEVIGAAARLVQLLDGAARDSATPAGEEPRMDAEAGGAVRHEPLAADLERARSLEAILNRAIALDRATRHRRRDHS